MALPIYIMIQKFRSALIALAVIGITTLVLKFT